MLFNKFNSCQNMSCSVRCNSAGFNCLNFLLSLFKEHTVKHAQVVHFFLNKKATHENVFFSLIEVLNVKTSLILQCGTKYKEKNVTCFTIII